MQLYQITLKLAPSLCGPTEYLLYDSKSCFKSH